MCMRASRKWALRKGRDSNPARASRIGKRAVKLIIF